MKKNLTIILAIALSFGVFAQQNTWPSALGNVSFATDSTWTISGNDIFQIWSDAVQTDYCSNKTSFRGGLNVKENNEYIDNEWVHFYVDCRSNPGQKGDLFSWLAVYELRNELCPYPWRVPTVQDFIDLDIALGGTGRNIRDSAHRNKYLNVWGGAYGGTAWRDGVGGQGGIAHYWSQSEFCESTGYTLSFSRRDGTLSSGTVIEGSTRPQSVMTKDTGLSLRCVRDN